MKSDEARFLKKKNSSEKQKQPDKNFFYLNMKVLMILQLSLKKNVREKLGKNMIHELWFRNL